VGKIIEASAPTIRLDATPSGPSIPPPPSSPNFTPDVLPAATLPIYPDLRQAPNMLDCIPGGLVEEGHPACKKTECAGARCRLAYGPGDASATCCILLQ